MLFLWKNDKKIPRRGNFLKSGMEVAEHRRGAVVAVIGGDAVAEAEIDQFASLVLADRRKF